VVIKEQPNPPGPIALHSLSEAYRTKGAKTGLNHVPEAGFICLPFLVPVKLVGNQAGAQDTYVHSRAWAGPESSFVFEECACNFPQQGEKLPALYSRFEMTQHQVSVFMADHHRRHVSIAVQQSRKANRNADNFPVWCLRRKCVGVRVGAKNQRGRPAKFFGDCLPGLRYRQDLCAGQDSDLLLLRVEEPEAKFGTAFLSSLREYSAIPSDVARPGPGEDRADRDHRGRE
jgi:hypothetical protein